MRKIIMIAAGAMALAIPAAASASVTVNDAGVGFVGKGDVQSALGWNNGQVQNPANWNSLAFTYKQDVSQSATQNLTQSAKQAGKLSVSQDVTCTITTGGVNHRNVFHRDGERDGSRTGERSGIRTGSRTGVANGTLAGSIAYNGRTGPQQQITGFNLTGNKPGSPVLTMGEFGWGADTFTNDYTFGDYTFETAVTWGGWVAEQGENPADCFNQSGNVSNLVDSGPVDGTITDGAITEGAVESGTIDYAKATPTGPVVLSVNGHQLG